MRLDAYSNPIFTEQDLFDALYQGHQIKDTDVPIVERTDNVIQLETVLGFKFVAPIDANFTREEFDTVLQSDWFMPMDYKTMDIEAWIWEQCPPWDPEHTRVQEELEAYKARNMLDLLRWLKYFVDTCRANNVVWGVGRGSSVASYVLFLIGVHKINSLKYNLDWQEFLR
jgi:DNA polymerase III alpha subunit